MKNSYMAGGLSAVIVGVLGIAWFAIETIPPRLGFDDTDNPAVMVQFIRSHPHVFVYSGLTTILVGIFLVVASTAVGELISSRSSVLTRRSLTILGLFTAAFFLVNGAAHIQASGPLLHMAELRGAWGEGAYLAFQILSQSLLIMALTTLSLWAVGLSLIGLRTRILPVALCALGILPAARIVVGVLGPLNLVPDGLWILGLISVPGLFLWCLALGVVVLVRSRRAGSEPEPGGRAAVAVQG